MEIQSQMREVYENKYIVRLSGCELHNEQNEQQRGNFLLKSNFKIKCIFSICGGKAKDKWRPRKREDKEKLINEDTLK